MSVKCQTRKSPAPTYSFRGTPPCATVTPFESASGECRIKGIVIATFFVGGLSVASAIFLILEMGQPFAGLMQISSEEPRHALAPLDP